jgi:farnesyl diphosphate synthase
MFLLLQENYARRDAECVKRVKAIYVELGLPELYAKYEDESYTSLCQLIDSSSGSLPRDMFIAYADKIYKRKK